MLRKIVLVSALLLLFIFPALSSAQSGHTLQLTLTLNNTQNSVYIPGVGIRSSGSMTKATYTSPPHFFLASFLNSNLKALVFSQLHPVSISVSNNNTHHVLSASQNLTGSQSFLVFTRGDHTPILNRIHLIESGNFLTEISPSFSFGLGELIPVALKLNYSDIDLQGSFTLRKGVHQIVLQSNTSGSTKTLIINETTGG